MAKINYQNLPSTSTPLNATNLNAMQEIITAGTWTPALGTVENTDPTVTYTTQEGTYYKLDKIVFFSFYIRAKITALNGTNNYAKIKGLPFAATGSFGTNNSEIGSLYGAVDNTNDAAFIVSSSDIRVQYNYGANSAKWVVTSGTYMQVAGNGFYFTS